MRGGSWDSCLLPQVTSAGGALLVIASKPTREMGKVTLAGTQGPHHSETGIAAGRETSFLPGKTDHLL